MTMNLRKESIQEHVKGNRDGQKYSTCLSSRGRRESKGKSKCGPAGDRLAGRR